MLTTLFNMFVLILNGWRITHSKGVCEFYRFHYNGKPAKDFPDIDVFHKDGEVRYVLLNNGKNTHL